MESKIDSIENSLVAIEGILKLGKEREQQEQKSHGMWEEILQTRRKLDSIEGMLTTLLKGKSTDTSNEGDSQTIVNQGLNSQRCC